MSKSLHYINSPLVSSYFGISIGVWIYLRHYLNLRIILSVFTEFQAVGPYELNWETQQYNCLVSNVITFGLLAVLQALNIFWLLHLLRSAYWYVVYNIKKDDRSEAEESDPEELEELKKEEHLALLNSNAFASSSANSVIKTTGSGTATLPTKRKTAL